MSRSRSLRRRSQRNVPTDTTDCDADKPKMFELISLKKPGKQLTVIKWITSHEQWKCVDFANLLLKDDILVRKLQNEHKDKDDFVRAVLRDWLLRDDGDSTDSAVPCTWSALAECVSDAGLDGALAKAIRDSHFTENLNYTESGLQRNDRVKNDDEAEITYAGSEGTTCVQPEDYDSADETIAPVYDTGSSSDPVLYSSGTSKYQKGTQKTPWVQKMTQETPWVQKRTQETPRVQHSNILLLSANICFAIAIISDLILIWVNSSWEFTVYWAEKLPYPAFAVLILGMIIAPKQMFPLALLHIGVLYEVLCWAVVYHIDPLTERDSISTARYYIKTICKMSVYVEITLYYMDRKIRDHFEYVMTLILFGPFLSSLGGIFLYFLESKTTLLIVLFVVIVPIFIFLIYKDLTTRKEHDLFYLSIFYILCELIVCYIMFNKHYFLIKICSFGTIYLLFIPLAIAAKIKESRSSVKVAWLFASLSPFLCYILYITYSSNEFSFIVVIFSVLLAFLLFFTCISFKTAIFASILIVIFVTYNIYIAWSEPLSVSSVTQATSQLSLVGALLYTINYSKIPSNFLNLLDFLMK